MKLSILLFLLCRMLCAREFVVSVKEDTLVSFESKVTGVNCIPSALGKVQKLQESPDGGVFFSLIPTGKKGKLICGFKLLKGSVENINFELIDKVLNPIVEVNKKNKENDFFNLPDLDIFYKFVKGDREGLVDNLSVLSRNTEYRKNDKSYILKENKVHSKGLSFWVFELIGVSSKSYIKEKLKINDVYFSTVLKTDSKRHLYIMTNSKIDLDKVISFLI